MKLFTIDPRQKKSVILSFIKNLQRNTCCFTYWTSLIQRLKYNYTECIVRIVCLYPKMVKSWTSKTSCIQEHASICYHKKEIPIDIENTTVKANDADYDCDCDEL